MVFASVLYNSCDVWQNNCDTVHARVGLCAHTCGFVCACTCGFVRVDARCLVTVFVGFGCDAKMG